MPKPSRRLRRGINAVERGFSRARRAVVHGAKVATGKQLTKKEMAFTDRGKTIRQGSFTVRYDRDGIGHRHVFVFRSKGKNVYPVIWSFYTPEGRLRVERHFSQKGYDYLEPYEPTDEMHYQPAGRFIGKRIRRKK